jgi:hypothetical protein
MAKKVFVNSQKIYYPELWEIGWHLFMGKNASKISIYYVKLYDISMFAILFFYSIEEKGRNHTNWD